MEAKDIFGDNPLFCSNFMISGVDLDERRY
jgi:hypothetical protein